MKYVYSFNEGNSNMRSLLGGKGANLCQMTTLGLPVPMGFIVTTEACTSYYENSETLSSEIIKQVEDKILELEKSTGKNLEIKKILY